jgi:hypothetical protein
MKRHNADEITNVVNRIRLLEKVYDELNLALDIDDSKKKVKIQVDFQFHGSTLIDYDFGNEQNDEVLMAIRTSVNHYLHSQREQLEEL